MQSPSLAQKTLCVPSKYGDLCPILVQKWSIGVSRVGPLFDNKELDINQLTQIGHRTGTRRSKLLKKRQVQEARIFGSPYLAHIKICLCITCIELPCIQCWLFVVYLVHFHMCRVGLGFPKGHFLTQRPYGLPFVLVKFSARTYHFRVIN